MNDIVSPSGSDDLDSLARVRMIFCKLLITNPNQHGESLFAVLLRPAFPAFDVMTERLRNFHFCGPALAVHAEFEIVHGGLATDGQV